MPACKLCHTLKDRHDTSAWSEAQRESANVGVPELIAHGVIAALSEPEDNWITAADAVRIIDAGTTTEARIFLAKAIAAFYDAGGSPYEPPEPCAASNWEGWLSEFYPVDQPMPGRGIYSWTTERHA